MLAEPLIPKAIDATRRVDENTHQMKVSKARGSYESVLFSVCRRLQARINELEKTASTLRRDVNRIDKKLYRESKATEELPAQIEETVQIQTEEMMLPGLGRVN